MLTMENDTLPKLFARNAKLYAGKVALREKDLGIWQRTTWQEYWDHVCFFALGLTQLGLERGDKLSILGDNCREWLYADLATQSCAATTIGIYPTDVSSQVRYILDNSESSFVVVKDQEQTDKILEVKDSLPRLKKIIVVDMKGLRRYNDPLIVSFKDVEALGKAFHEQEPHRFEEMVQGTKAEDVAIIVYTSGTTGQPKGAMLSHKNVVGMIRGLSQVLHFSPSDSLVSVLPLCHVAERMFSLIFPMWAGCTGEFCRECGYAAGRLGRDFPHCVSQRAPNMGKDAFEYHDTHAGRSVLQAVDFQSYAPDRHVDGSHETREEIGAPLYDRPVRTRVPAPFQAVEKPPRAP